jgi:hypothetical protein
MARKSEPSRGAELQRAYTVTSCCCGEIQTQ